MTKSRNSSATRRRWTDAEIAALRLMYPDTLTIEIAERLGASVERVYAKAAKLGLKKSEAFLASPAAGRLQPGSTVGLSGRYPKGHVPANKGQRRPGWTAGRMAETQFKKGRPASEARNYVPIGSLRFSKDGYLERKVTDDPSLFPARRWIGVHRLVWQAENGPVPAGHLVVFKPGQRTTVEDEITIDRLECISFAENMRRNTVHNLPKPLAQAVQLRGALVRKINRATKEAAHD